ncbi:MAG: hypothetical protein V4535_00240 [Bacteroidota bacterium]
MKKIVLLFVLISSYAFSQGVNDYQYVVVPAKFSLFKENNKYNLNSTTKLLLEKYGFKTYMSTDEIPDNVGNCQKLYADLVEDNSFLNTKIKLVLKDCKEAIVYETEYGKSREKDYVVAHNQALRETAKSFDKLNYKYNGKNELAFKAIEVKSEMTPLKTLNNQTQSVNETPASSLSTGSSETFYFAQPIANGYQLVDTEPKVIMKLFTTSQKNVFIGVKGNINGTVILKNGEWFFEYYENGKLVSELLKLKF